MRNAYKTLAGNLKRRDQLGYLGIGERITLKWMLGK
jgi:hypothetical protein